MNKTFVIFLLILAGSFVSLQASINARLAKHVGFLESAFISFFVGTITLFIFLMLKGEHNLKNITDVPLLYLTGGILGAIFVYSITYSVHITGVTTALAITIGVQLFVGLILDKFDPMKVIKLNIGLLNVLGIILIILGVILTSWRK
ncbi:MAG: bacterial/archaeal transporter family-2 protein [Deferribacteres bacterium]|nr:bacterial/archaeal transporter family-2 protein [Deferribacteres bacterium]